LPYRTATLFRFGFLTGLRRSGMLRIEAKDIDRAAGVIHTWSKGRAGGRYTPVVITAGVAKLLDEIGVPDVGRLFAITPMQIRRDVVKARAATGLADITLRRTRHSFAQDLEDAGEGDSITAALHHSDPKLRRRYSKVRMEKLRGALERAQSRSSRRD
jgi:integrase